MYYSKVYLHLMWTTDDCKKNLHPYANKLGKYLISLGEKRGIKIRMIAVLPDHVHCMVRLSTVQSISEIVQILKGSSSHWMNNNSNLTYKFKWEDEYFAFSFGVSQLPDFEKYFEIQSSYHTKHTVLDEINQLDQRYKLNYKN